VIKDGKPLSELDISSGRPANARSWHGGPPPSKERARRFAPGGLVGEAHDDHTQPHHRFGSRQGRRRSLLRGDLRLRFEGLGGHFAPVRVNDTLTLDFNDAKGTITSPAFMRFT